MLSGTWIHIPRIRGVEPCLLLLCFIVFIYSPHTRGWTQRSCRLASIGSIFPAYAGVNLRGCLNVRNSWIFPAYAGLNLISSFSDHAQSENISSYGRGIWTPDTINLIKLELYNTTKEPHPWNFSTKNHTPPTTQLRMLMCHKVTHKNLIDSSPLFRYCLTHASCNFFVKTIDSDTSKEI